MREPEDLKLLARRVLDRMTGVEAAEVFVRAWERALTRFAGTVIHQNVAESGVEISVRAVQGRRSGSATTTHTNDPALDAVIADACATAAASPEDPEMVPVAEPGEFPDPEAYVPETLAFGPAERAAALEPLFEPVREQGFEAAGYLNVEGRATVMATSAGLLALDRRTQAAFSATVMAGDDAASGWAEAIAHNARDLDVAGASQAAIAKAERNQRPIAIEPGAYTVILEPAAVAELAGFLGWLGCGALAVEEERSFMVDRFGQRITGENFTLTDDAAHPLHRGTSFDGEGTRRQCVALIENGVARGVVYDKATAARAGVQSTGHGGPYPNPMGPMPGHLVISRGESDLDAMIAQVQHGVLVTRLWYSNVVEPLGPVLTGMTRDGTFLIEGGALGPAAKNLRYNVNVLDIFSRIRALGHEMRLSDGVVAPAMLIEGFTFTGVTG